MDKISNSASAEQQNLLFNMDVIKPFPQQGRETVQRTMLRHEKTFQNQVHELHRLYKVQRMMANEATCRTSSHFFSASPQAIIGLSSEVTSMYQKGNKTSFWNPMGHPVFSCSNTNLPKHMLISEKQQFQILAHYEKTTINNLDDAGSKSNRQRKKIIDLEKPPYDDTEDEAEDCQGFNVSAESMPSLSKRQPTEIVLESEADPSRRLDHLTDKMHLLKNEAYQMLDVTRSVIIDQQGEALTKISPKSGIKCSQDVLQNKLLQEENISPSSSFPEGASVSEAGMIFGVTGGKSVSSTSGLVIPAINVTSKGSLLDSGLIYAPDSHVHFPHYEHPVVIQTQTIQCDRQVPWLQSAAQLFHGSLYMQQPVYSANSCIKASESAYGVPIDLYNRASTASHNSSHNFNMPHNHHCNPSAIRPLKLILASDASRIGLRLDKVHGEPLSLGTSMSESMEEFSKITTSIDETMTSHSIVDPTRKSKQGSSMTVMCNDQDILLNRISSGTERLIPISSFVSNNVRSIDLDQNPELRAQFPRSFGGSENAQCTETRSCEQGYIVHLDYHTDAYSTRKDAHVSEHYNQHAHSATMTDVSFTEKIGSIQGFKHRRIREISDQKSLDFPVQELQKISGTEQSYSGKTVYDGIVPLFPAPSNTMVESSSNKENERQIHVAEEEEQVGVIVKTNDGVVPLLLNPLNTEAKNYSNEENESSFLVSEKEDRAQQECNSNSYNNTVSTSDGCKIGKEKSIRFSFLPSNGSFSSSCRNEKEILKSSSQSEQKKHVEENRFQVKLRTQETDGTSLKEIHSEDRLPDLEAEKKELKNVFLGAKQPLVCFKSDSESCRNLDLYIPNMSATIQAQVDHAQNDPEGGDSERSRSYLVEEFNYSVIGHHKHHNDLNSNAILPKQEVEEDSSQCNRPCYKNRTCLTNSSTEEVIKLSLPEGDDDCHNASLAASILLSFAPADIENDKSVSKNDIEKHCKKSNIKAVSKRRQLDAAQRLDVFDLASSRTVLNNGRTKRRAQRKRQTERLDCYESVTLILRNDSTKKHQDSDLRSDNMAQEQQIDISNGLQGNFKTVGEQGSTPDSICSMNQSLQVLSGDVRMSTCKTTPSKDIYVKNGIGDSTSRIPHKSDKKGHKLHCQNKNRKATRKAK